MSISLDRRPTDPIGINVKTYVGDVVHLGRYDISLEDFLIAANYVLTNTDLIGENDPRLAFIERVKGMRIVDGFNEGGRRLESNNPPVPV